MEKGSAYPPQQYPHEQPPPYSQPPPGYTVNTVVVTQPPHILVSQSFREIPVRITCPQCQADVMTAMSYETGMLTWMIFGGLCLVGLWCGCCMVPFCVDACKDVIHSCPNCNQVVGRFNRVS